MQASFSSWGLLPPSPALAAPAPWRSKPLPRPYKVIAGKATQTQQLFADGGWEWCQASDFGRETFQTLAQASGADVACESPAFRELGGQQARTGAWTAHRTGKQRSVDTALM